MARQSNSKLRTRKHDRFQHDGEPSVFTCPDCQGTLFLVQHGRIVQFRCRIGHLYSPESMLEAQNDNVERLMWSATRALEEQAEYIHQIAEQIAKASEPEQRRQYEVKSRSALERADVIRKLLNSDPDC
jgi:two-component system chemotaxis response regulator CheB